MADSEDESDWTSGEDEPSMRNMLKGLTSTMTTLNTRMDDLEGGGQKKRRVSFHRARPSEEDAASLTASPSTAALPAAASTSTAVSPPAPRLPFVDPSIGQIFSRPL